MKTSTKNSVVNTDRKRTQRSFAIEKENYLDLYSKPLSYRQRKKLDRVKHAREKRLHTIEHCRNDGLTFAKDNKRKSKFDNRTMRVSQFTESQLDKSCQNVSETTFKDKYARHTMYSSTTKKTYNIQARSTTPMENNSDFIATKLPNGHKKYTKQRPFTLTHWNVNTCYNATTPYQGTGFITGYSSDISAQDAVEEDTDAAREAKKHKQLEVYIRRTIAL